MNCGSSGFASGREIDAISYRLVILSRKAFHHLPIALFLLHFASLGEFGDSSQQRESAMSCAHVGLLSLFRETICERLWCFLR